MSYKIRNIHQTITINKYGVLFTNLVTKWQSVVSGELVNITTVSSLLLHFNIVSCAMQVF